MRLNAVFYAFVFALLLVLTTVAAAAQSIYRFEYNFQQADDSIHYHALFTRYNNGTGLLRIRYIAPLTAQDVVVEMDADEEPPFDTATGITDTGRLQLLLSTPRVIIGDNRVVFNPPVFQLTHSAATGFFEPSGVIAGTGTTTSPAKASFTASLMQGGALSKTFVSAFFSEDEDFYSNLFRPGSKGLSAAEKNTTLFLLVVADTLDASIGTSCSLDMSRMRETFKAITDTLGIRTQVKAISGAMYSKATVQAAIAQLKPAVNDIVVFYYSGHGFRLEQTKRFPNIKLKTNHTSRQDVLNNSLNIEEIFTQIKKKGARFNLVLSDCCNNDIETNNSTGSKPGQTKGSGIPWDLDNCRNLFLNKTPISILATAADNGQRASSKNDFGGFFSYFFATSLENYCSKLKSNVSWDMVLQDTQAQTSNKAKHTYCDKPYIPANICSQFPYYIVRQ